MSERFDIRLALIEKDRRAVRALRLQTARRDPYGPIQDGEAEPILEGIYLLGAFDNENGRAVGFLRMHVQEDPPAPDAHVLHLERFGQYNPHHIAVISELGTAKDIERDADIVVALLHQAVCVSLLHRLEFMCGAFEGEWLPLLKSIGFREYVSEEVYRDQEGGVPLAISVSDSQYLVDIGSRIAPLASAFARNEFSVSFFHKLIERSTCDVGDGSCRKDARDRN